jgi:hypothetical protein
MSRNYHNYGPDGVVGDYAIASLLLLLLHGRAVAFSHYLTSRSTVVTVKTLDFELCVPLDPMFARIASVVSLIELATDKLSTTINIVLLFYHRHLRNG